jgi:hypothetical protein
MWPWGRAKAALIVGPLNQVNDRVRPGQFRRIRGRFPAPLNSEHCEVSAGAKAAFETGGGLV